MFLSWSSKILVNSGVVRRRYSTDWGMSTNRKNCAPDSPNISIQYGCQHVFLVVPCFLVRILEVNMVAEHKHDIVLVLKWKWSSYRCNIFSVFSITSNKVCCLCRASIFDYSIVASKPVRGNGSVSTLYLISRTKAKIPFSSEKLRYQIWWLLISVF